MKRYKIIALFVLTAAVYAGCKHDTEMFEGPALNDLYGEFSIVSGLDITNRNVDFAAGESTQFSATFSKNVNWKLRVTGLNSGAVKVFTALSNQLSPSNATWNGSTTIFPLFGAEECAVMLTVENETDTLRDTLTVASPKVDAGFLVADFENGANPDWEGFVQSGANMSFNITDQGPQAQGNFYYDMGGEVNWDWLIGMIEFPALAYGAPHFPLSVNPDNVWINMLLYKPTGIDNSLILLQLREDENADSTATETSEDMWSREIMLQDDGWQLISIRYSDMEALVDGQPSVPNGNTLHEPHKLGRISVLMLANPASGYSQALMDYVIITEGGPLTP